MLLILMLTKFKLISFKQIKYRLKNKIAVDNQNILDTIYTFAKLYLVTLDVATGWQVL